MSWMTVLQLCVVVAFAGVVAEVVLEDAIGAFGKLYDREERRDGGGADNG